MSLIMNTLRVLVVGNDGVYRKILTAQVQALGAETLEAGSGKEALEYFTSGFKFDLVLMEIDMPIMDGCEAAWEIRIMRKGPIGIKIVGLTANPTSWGEVVFKQSGGDEYYSKPIKDVELIAILREVDSNI